MAGVESSLNRQPARQLPGRPSHGGQLPHGPLAIGRESVRGLAVTGEESVSPPQPPTGTPNSLPVRFVVDVVNALSEAAWVFTGAMDQPIANTAANALVGGVLGSPYIGPANEAMFRAFSEPVWMLLRQAQAGTVPIDELINLVSTDQWLHARVTRCGETGLLLLLRDVTEQQQMRSALDREEVRSAELESHVLSEADRIEELIAHRAQQMAAREEAMNRDRRLAAIGQLAAGVMHDVNNALNPIMAAAYLLRHHAESPDAVRDYADRIRKAAEMGAATASRVGRFIRQEPMHAGSDELMDLSVAANELLELAEPMLQQRAGNASDVRLVRDFVGVAPMRGVPGEIREALLNLLTNSLDAMPRGGTLTVRTFIDGPDAVVSVHDTGMGMTNEVRERAFEPFYTTKGAGGSGLGLAEVYGIVRRHRGAAFIESTLGSGALVSLRFPTEQASGPPVVVELDVTPTPSMHILVVEDHDDGRELLQRMLQADGHSVDAVESCALAREKLAKAPLLHYHLMLTDVGLPDGSGWDVVKFAHQLHPELRIGVITGWEPMVKKTDAVGVEFVLRKPLRATELLSHIAGRHRSALPE